MATAVDENMAMLDAQLFKQREEELKDLRNKRSEAFAKKLGKNIDSKMKVLVKLSPTPRSEVAHIESLHFTITCDRNIRVRAFKKQIAALLGEGLTDFKLLDSSIQQRRLRDEESLRDVLLTVAENDKQQRRWPAPYQGLVWVEI